MKQPALRVTKGQGRTRASRISDGGCELKFAILLLVLMLVVIGCTSPSATLNTNTADPLETILREYKGWTTLFQSPRNVSFFLMALCRTQTADEVAYQASEHAQYAVQVYVNPTTATVIKQEGARTFPAGSVIVKEKWAHDDKFAKLADATQPAGLGIMLKDKNGWQYAYVDEKGTITRDQKQLDNCRVCHSTAAERDSVFYPAVMSE